MFNYVIGLWVWPAYIFAFFDQIWLFYLLFFAGSLLLIGGFGTLYFLFGRFITSHFLPYWRNNKVLFFSIVAPILLVLASPPFVFLWYLQNLSTTFTTTSKATQTEALTLYRSEQLNTYLGKLPTPMRIYQANDGNFFGTTISGEKIPIELGVQIVPDKGSEIFFDKYDDRIFYWKNNGLVFYDLLSDKVVQLPESIGGTCGLTKTDLYPQGTRLRCPKIVRVFGDYIALLHHPDTFSPKELKTYVISTGNPISHSVDTVSDGLRTVYQIGLNDYSYILTIDTRDKNRYFGPLPKDHPSYIKGNAQLSFYLEETNSKSIKELQKIQIADSEGNAYWNARTPFFVLPTHIGLPDKVSDDLDYNNYFRIRSLFKIDESTLAQEVDDGLVVIDIANKQARFTSDPAEVDQLLKNSVLLSEAYSIAGVLPALFQKCDELLKFEKVDVKASDKIVFCLE